MKLRIIVSIGLIAGTAPLALGMASRRPASCQWATAEMMRGVDGVIRARALTNEIDRYQGYSATLLDDSAGTNMFKDKGGNCRLAWYDRMMRRQKTAPLIAERFTRELHGAACQSFSSMAATLKLAMEKLNVTEKNWPRDDTRGLAGLALLTASMAGMKDGVERAFKPFSPDERAAFPDRLAFETLSAHASGHRFETQEGGRAVCDRMERMDRIGLLFAARHTAALADAWTRGDLDGWMRDLSGRSCTATVAGVTGSLAAVIPTAAGLIVVGGTNDNVYALDENPAIAAVVELGGNDRYEEGTLSAARPVLILIDRRGNDRYAGEKTGIQGGAVGGVSILLEGGGNDRYEARYLAQGACLAGLGILVDAGGDDVYRADQRAQGHGLGGVGVLIDRSGNDAYRGALLVQGVGGPLGFGLLDDAAGADTYFAGGKYPGGYADTPGFGSWSQGVGIGPHGVANGGIGVLLDGGGDDLYEYDYFSHGGGYWFGVGMTRDFGGNDRRIGATRVRWDGSPRTEPRFVRWGPAFGCHYAMGFLFDDGGDDQYFGNHAGVGFSWDIALSVLCDAAGDDVYDEPGSGIGQAHQVSCTIFFDGGGNDRYRGAEPGLAGPVSEEHTGMGTNSNFAFVIDQAGQDVWSCGLSNGQSRVQGWAGGVLIDR